MKRIVFIGVQHTHTIATDEYQLPAVRTGYESVIPLRVSSMFAAHAAEDCVVESVTDKGIIVKGVSGTRYGLKIGRYFGKAEGKYYPHDVVSDLKVGDKVKKGFPLAWNTYFFDRDFFNPGRLCYKTNQPVKTAFMECPETWEDSNAISERMMTSLSATVTKLRSVTVKFTDNILRVVKVGEQVNPESVLMYITDDMGVTQGNFSDASIELLNTLQGNSPRADVRGIIDRIEVIYHGDKQDMSASLRSLANAYEKLLVEEGKATASEPMIGKVDGEYRVEGMPLKLDTAEIRVYLSYKDTQSVADKIVLGNQMKTTTSNVMRGVLTTKAGEIIDAKFSYKKVSGRIVDGLMRLASSTTALRVGSKKMADIYFGKI